MNDEKNIFLKKDYDYFDKLGYFFIIGFGLNLLLNFLKNIYNTTLSFWAGLITGISIIGCFTFLFFGLYIIKKRKNNSRNLLLITHVLILIDSFLSIFISLILPFLTKEQVYMGIISQESRMFLLSQYPIFVNLFRYAFISIFSIISIINIYFKNFVVFKVLRIFSIITVCIQIFVFLVSMATYLGQFSLESIILIIQNVIYSVMIIFILLFLEMDIRISKITKKENKYD